MNLISIFRRLFLPLVVLLLAATAGAQSAYDEIKADIDKAGGVYFMYPFDTPSATPAPKGYEPFYISHYGRHGARYILSNDQYDNVAEVLRRARADGKLTARGIDACDRFLAIYPHLKGRAGDLTPKGQMQHRRLAGRMYAAYPEIFRRHPRIEAYSTVVPRCIMSMAAFCEGLKEADPSLEIFTETSSVNMYYLNPHSTGNPAGTAEDFRYKSADAPWRPEWRRFCEERIDVESILVRLFTDTAYARSICDPLKFEQDLFSVAAHMQCTDLDESFYDLFTFDELCRFWECDNYTYYVEKGPDPRNRGRGTALAETLLDDIVSRAGEDMAAGEPSVRLRFGHDGCIMALLTLMRIDGWTTPVTDPAKIKDVWQVHRIPMASNMQFVFYRNKKNPDDVLVRVLLNEKELRLPLPGDRAPTTGGRISGISMPESYGKPDLNSKPRNETDSQNAAFRSRTGGRLPAGGDRPDRCRRTRQGRTHGCRLRRRSASGGRLRVGRRAVRDDRRRRPLPHRIRQVGGLRLRRHAVELGCCRGRRRPAAFLGGARRGGCP